MTPQFIIVPIVLSRLLARALNAIRSTGTYRCFQCKGEHFEADCPEVARLVVRTRRRGRG